MPLTFSLRKVCKQYGKGPAAVCLRNLDLDVEDQELLVLLGPSGSAKSIPLNILGGPDRATSSRPLQLRCTKINL